MNYLTLSDEQLELLESVLTDWERQETQEVAPRVEMLDGLREVRFRAIDVPRVYREEQPWREDTSDTQTVVYAFNEELGRDAVPRNPGFGYPEVVEVSADYDEDEPLEELHDDVAMVTNLAHKFGWTLHDYTEDHIMLRPAEDEHTVDNL